jgi:hypothetical protein
MPNFRRIWPVPAGPELNKRSSKLQANDLWTAELEALLLQFACAAMSGFPWEICTLVELLPWNFFGTLAHISKFAICW